MKPYQQILVKHPVVCTRCGRRYPPHHADTKCSDHPTTKLWDQRTEPWWEQMVGDATPWKDAG